MRMYDVRCVVRCKMYPYSVPPSGILSYKEGFKNRKSELVVQTFFIEGGIFSFT